MKRSKMLIAAAASGVVLAAAAVPAVVNAQTAPATTTSQGSGGALPPGCQYPATRKPVLTMTPSSTMLPKGGGPVQFRGTMKINGCGIGGRPIDVYSASRKDGSYSKFSSKSATTDGSGAYTVTFNVKNTAWFIAVFAGDTSYDPARSTPAQVTVAK